MDTKKNAAIIDTDDEEFEEEDFTLEDAGMNPDLTVAVPRKEEKYTGPMVPVFLPEIEGGETEGIQVDQYEHVTIANEKGEKIWHVKRGVSMEVPVPVFIALKERYPKI